MNRLSLIAIAALLLASTSSYAQENRLPQAMVHGFFGGGPAISGGASGFLHYGGGFDIRVIEGLSGGAEIGFLHPGREFSSGFGLFSANGTYHFKPTVQRGSISPFVTGGYSLAFRNGHANLGNFGGGIDYSFGRSKALRFEVRDHVWPDDGGVHFLTFRIGLLAF